VQEFRYIVAGAGTAGYVLAARLRSLSSTGTACSGSSVISRTATRPHSRRTVATHLTSIFRKLGVSSRAELAAMAARRGS
jgi:hypothetical protein